MAARVTERRLVDVLVEYLRKTREVRREVRHYEKRIDVVAFISHGNVIEGIEAKCCDWTRAVQQAILNLTAVDFSYVAMWSETAHRIERDLLDEFGIGLIAVGTKWGDVKLLVEARRSEFTNRFVRQQIGEGFVSEQFA
jgi:hypothetical protein